MLEYMAAPGETNRLSRDAPDGDEQIVRDEGAPLEPGPGCRRLSEHAVACQRAHTLVAELGDGDDTVSVSSARVKLGDGNDRFEGSYTEVDGGAGADVITTMNGVGYTTGGPGNDRLSELVDAAVLSGQEGDDVLTGGRQDDFLYAGPGVDTLDAGAGSDFLYSDDHPHAYAAPVEPDRFLGGDGHDFVAYAGHRVPVTVDLDDPGGDGAAGEDDVQGIEGVVGGQGGDNLLGDHGDNELIGGPGNDTLRGLNGRDFLEGGEDHDSFDAGAGDDLLSLWDSVYWYHYVPAPDTIPYGQRDAAGRVERAECGTGNDFIFDAYADLLRESCETLEMEGFVGLTALRAYPEYLTARKAVFAVPCPRAVRRRRRCEGRILLSAAGSRKQRRFSVPRTGGHVGVPLPAAYTQGETARVRLRYERADIYHPTAADYLIALPPRDAVNSPG